MALWRLVPSIFLISSMCYTTLHKHCLLGVLAALRLWSACHFIWSTFVFSYIFLFKCPKPYRQKCLRIKLYCYYSRPHTLGSLCGFEFCCWDDCAWYSQGEKICPIQPILQNSFVPSGKVGMIFVKGSVRITHIFPPRSLFKFLVHQFNEK